MTMIGSIPEYEIEEHVATTNRFFQLSGCTLDDLDVYSEPLSLAVKAVQGAADGCVTEEQVIETVRRAISQYKAIAAMDLVNAA
jgi:hypothetical protein